MKEPGAFDLFAKVHPVDYFETAHSKPLRFFEYLKSRYGKNGCVSDESGMVGNAG